MGSETFTNPSISKKILLTTYIILYTVNCRASRTEIIVRPQRKISIDLIYIYRLIIILMSFICFLKVLAVQHSLPIPNWSEFSLQITVLQTSPLSFVYLEQNNKLHLLAVVEAVCPLRCFCISALCFSNHCKTLPQWFLPFVFSTVWLC